MKISKISFSLPEPMFERKTRIYCVFWRQRLHLQENVNIFCPFLPLSLSLFHHRSHSALCMQTFNFSPPLYVWSYFMQRSPLPMFSCRLPNNKCVFFFFLVRREPLRAGKKMFDINACQLHFIDFLLSILCSVADAQPYTKKKVQTRANDEYV